MSAATLRSVLEIEMGSLGSATAETRSRSLVAERIRHFRIIGCFSPTGNETRPHRMINPDTNCVTAAQNHQQVIQRFQILHAYQLVNGVEKYY